MYRPKLHYNNFAKKNVLCQRNSPLPFNLYCSKFCSDDNIAK